MPLTRLTVSIFVLPGLVACLAPAVQAMTLLPSSCCSFGIYQIVPCLKSGYLAIYDSSLQSAAVSTLSRGCKGACSVHLLYIGGCVGGKLRKAFPTQRAASHTLSAFTPGLILVRLYTPANWVAHLSPVLRTHCCVCGCPQLHTALCAAITHIMGRWEGSRA